MRKIILSIMISLDGYIEAPGKDINWHNWGPEMDDYMTGFLNQIDTIILGRVAYEMLADFWPTSAAESENPQIAHKMNKLQKLVFSQTLSSAKWRNTSILREVSPNEIQKLKAVDGKDIVIFGGAKIAQSFIKLNLVDEFQLILNPVLLGKGNPLFSNNSALSQKLYLINTVPTKLGNVILIYKPIPQ